MEPNRPGNAGQYFEGLELRLGVGIVVGHVRAGVAAGDPEVHEQLRDGLGGHRGATVGVQGELIGLHTLASEYLGDERLGLSRS